MIQGSHEWHMARLGCVTASRISDVMMKPSTLGYQTYRAQLICERLTGKPVETPVSAAMQHGTDTEPQARANYELATGNEVQEAGFIPHPRLAMAGASPDGLIGSDGGLEIKCPQAVKHIRNLTGAEIDKPYMLQMQWGMACTGREWWDFASFCPEFPAHLRLSARRVPADAEMIEEITAAVTSFLADIESTLDQLNQKKAA